MNGQDLAPMMVRYDIGVRKRTEYIIKGVDEDYFGEAEL
jgi:restriction system protein